MSLYTALSGLNGAQKDLSVTSNNIANANTTGFRSSRTLFGDIYTNSPTAKSGSAVGGGVMVEAVQQQFTQGSVVDTGNTLDMAIEGQGFFATRPSLDSKQLVYTRAGAFSVDQNHNVVDATGKYLLAYPTATDGTPTTQDLTQAQPLNVPLSFGTAAATTGLSVSATLPGGSAAPGQQDAVPPTKAFDPTDPTTFAASTAMTIYDGKGNPSQAVAYFVRTQDSTAANPTTQYAVHMTVNGQPMTAATQTYVNAAGTTVTMNPGEIDFDSSGNLVQPTSPLSFSGTNLPTLSLDLTGTGLGVSAFSVQSASQNGHAPSGLSGVSVDTKGTVWANYAGGESKALGQVAMATFANLNGLKQIGNASWTATGTSGAPISGSAGSEGFGNLKSGSLEQSNVNLTNELVNLISEQRNYQASAKALQTESTVISTIVNIHN